MEPSNTGLQDLFRDQATSSNFHRSQNLLESDLIPGGFTFGLANPFNLRFRTGDKLRYFTGD